MSAVATTRGRVGCVIVDFAAGPHLAAAVDSVAAQGVERLVVVDNAGGGASLAALEGRDVPVLDTGRNLGFGGGVNRGVAALGECELVLVLNPDAVLCEGSLAAMVAALDANPTWGVVGPTILTEQLRQYPSVRNFPSTLDAVGHATLGWAWPENPFTRRYRGQGARPDGTADWVSGSCFVIRRELFERVGGFDEAYFMFAEDMDLCFRSRIAGAEVGTAPEAVVIHVEGVSRRIAPYRMKIAHHRSALRFAMETTRGPARVLLPLAALILGMRLLASLATTALRGR